MKPTKQAKYSTIKAALASPEGKALYKALELEFCQALSLSPQCVTDAMSQAPCYLGSKKHFEQTVFFALAAIDKARGE